jgi:bromodomain-containing factor 1
MDLPPVSESKPNGEDFAAAAAAADAPSKNEGAFSANKAIPDETNDSNDKNNKKEPAKPRRESEHEIASGMDKVNMHDAAAPPDTDMPDAPTVASTDRASEDKLDEGLSPKSHPKSHPKPEPEAQSAGPEDEEEETTPDAKIETPAVSGPSVPSPPEEKEDVTMADTQEQAETSTAADTSTAAAVSEGTQETAVTAATPGSPKSGVDIPAAENQDKPVDALTSMTSAPPSTADTSMSEAAQPSAKVSRERDIDSEDEPVAKRTKVDPAAAQVHVKTGPAEDRMQVDQHARSRKASPILGSGEPKKLDDDSLDDKPLTDWQNKQIRAVLAGVKKTKVGVNFRLPVQQLWPVLWTDYAAKISNPTDISTMEKRLRGDGPRYVTMGDFKADLNLLVENAVNFNSEAHDVTNQARACRDAILARMALVNAVEPPKPERKEAAKAHTTRHVEPRAPVPPLATAGVARPTKGSVASPSQKAAVPESPAFALPPGSNGVPLIRRDSTKPDSRAKRPVKPAHSKDLVYDTKRKKKLPLDLRFCDELLTELRKTKHYDINAAFMQPVDPVALNIPHYHKVIKRPMDLSTMSNKLGSGEYQSSKEFEKDFDLIIKNCRTFNGEDHIVYAQALRLQDLYRAELSKKEEWMAKHAPVPVAAASHAAGGDSDSDEADSEPDAEADDERKQVENRLATIQKRLQAEQHKVDEMVNSGTADITDVEIAQSVVAMLQKQLMGERAKLANLPAKKAGKPKPAKAKKTGGAGGGGFPAKKAAAGGLGGGGAVRKSGTKKAAPKRKIGQVEKEIVIESLGNLDGPLLERAIDLIKKDTHQNENDAGELELDIETVSEEALVKLYDIALKANPNARIEKERQLGVVAPPPSHSPAVERSKQPLSKHKKNKPMSKNEQEKRIQQLNELRAQAGRQASGSQEPMESIEGNGSELATQLEHESDEDEVDSEED